MTALGYRLLIVDDESAIRNLLSLHFKDTGYNVRTAADGLEALDVIAEHNPHAIITDIKMPRMDGEQFFSYLKNYYPFIPTVVMTAHESETLSASAFLNSGASAYVNKPFALDDMSNLISRLMKHMKHVSKNDSRYKNFLDYGFRELLVVTDYAVAHKFEDQLAELPDTFHLSYARPEDVSATIPYHDFDGIIYDSNYDLDFREEAINRYSKSYPFMFYRSADLPEVDLNDILAYIAEIDLAIAEYANTPTINIGITGPGGAGKTITTSGLATALRSTGNRIPRYVTRPPRSFELNGEDHIFVLPDAVETRKDIIFFKHYRGNYHYGLPLSANIFRNGMNNILTIADTNLFSDITTMYPELMTIFIDSDPNDIARWSLHTGRTDSGEQILQNYLAFRTIKQSCDLVYKNPFAKDKHEHDSLLEERVADILNVVNLRKEIERA